MMLSQPVQFCCFCRQPSAYPSGAFVCVWCGRANGGSTHSEGALHVGRVAEQELQGAERAKDDAMWELARRSRRALANDEEAALMRWSTSFSGVRQHERPEDERDYQKLLQEVDSWTQHAVDVFLEESARITPIPVEVAQRGLRLRVEERRKGMFRRQRPPQETARIVGEKRPGHRIVSWSRDAGTLEGPRDLRCQDLYLLTDGTLRLHGGYPYTQVQRSGRPGQPPLSALATNSYTAQPGQLPGFLAPFRVYTAYGPLIPGLPRAIVSLQKTAAWLAMELRRFLASAETHVVDLHDH